MMLILVLTETVRQLVDDYSAKFAILLQIMILSCVLPYVWTIDQNSLELSVQMVCRTNVTLHWMNSQYTWDECSLLYSIGSESKSHKLNKYKQKPNTVSQTILLYGLVEKMHYRLWLVCNDDGAPYRAQVEFNTTSSSDVCRKAQISMIRTLHTTTPEGQPSIVRVKLNTHVQPLDMALGVILALFGVLAMAIAAFYVWRKYKRRQRIARFLRHTDSDPFDYIQPRFDDSTSHLQAGSSDD